jgi:hypothetical protein
MSDKKPDKFYFLILFYLFLISITSAWTWYAYTMFTGISGWKYSDEIVDFIAFNYFVFLFGFLIWAGITILLIILLYGLIRNYRWAWTTSLIIATLGLVLFPIILIAIMTTLLKYQSAFSSLGIITITIALLLDICVVYILTRPVLKQYFEK